MWKYINPANLLNFKTKGLTSPRPSCSPRIIPQNVKEIKRAKPVESTEMVPSNVQESTDIVPQPQVLSDIKVKSSEIKPACLKEKRETVLDGGKSYNKIVSDNGQASSEVVFKSKEESIKMKLGKSAAVVSQNKEDSTGIVSKKQTDSPIQIVFENENKSSKMKPTKVGKRKEAISCKRKDSNKSVCGSVKVSTEMELNSRKMAAKNNAISIEENIESASNREKMSPEIVYKNKNQQNQIKLTNDETKVESISDNENDLTETVSNNKTDSPAVVCKPGKRLTEIRKGSKEIMSYSNRESKKLKLEGLIETIKNMSHSKQETENIFQDTGDSNEHRFSSVKDTTKIDTQIKVESTEIISHTETGLREIVPHREKKSKKLEGVVQTIKSMSQIKEELPENNSHEFSGMSETMSHSKMESNILPSENKLSIPSDLKSILKTDTSMVKNEIKNETDIEVNVKFSSPVVTGYIDISPGVSDSGVQQAEPSHGTLKYASKRLSYSSCNELNDLYDETLTGKGKISLIEINTTEDTEALDTDTSIACELSETIHDDNINTNAPCPEIELKSEPMDKIDCVYEENHHCVNNMFSSIGISHMKSSESAMDFDESFDAEARDIILAPFFEDDSECYKPLQNINEAIAGKSEIISTTTQKSDTNAVTNSDSSAATTELEDDLNYIRNFLFEISGETVSKGSDNCVSSSDTHDINLADSYSYNMITSNDNKAVASSSFEFSNLCDSSFPLEQKWLETEELANKVVVTPTKNNSGATSGKRSEPSSPSTVDVSNDSPVDDSYYSVDSSDHSTFDGKDHSTLHDDKFHSTFENSKMYSEHITNGVTAERGLLIECEQDKSKNCIPTSVGSSETSENFNIAEIPILISCDAVKSPPNNISTNLENIKYEETTCETNRDYNFFEMTDKADPLYNFVQKNENTNNTECVSSIKSKMEKIEIFEDIKILELGSVVPDESKDKTQCTTNDHKMGMESVNSVNPVSENILQKSKTDFEWGKSKVGNISIVSSLDSLSGNIMQKSESDWECYTVEDDKIILDLTNSFKPVAPNKIEQETDINLEYGTDKGSEMFLEPNNTTCNTEDLEVIEKLSSLNKTEKPRRGRKPGKNKSQMIQGESIQQNVKRRRVRKPKIVENSSNGELPPKRPRGRPRKVRTEEANQFLKSESLPCDVIMKQEINDKTIQEIKAVDSNHNANISNLTCDFQSSDLMKFDGLTKDTMLKEKKTETLQQVTKRRRGRPPKVRTEGSQFLKSKSLPCDIIKNKEITDNAVQEIKAVDLNHNANISSPTCDFQSSAPMEVGGLTKDIEPKEKKTKTLQQVTKRPRGRPPKVKTGEEENGQVKQPKIKGPGRKRKVVTVDEEFNLKSKKLIQDIDTFGFDNAPPIEHVDIKTEATNEKTGNILSKYSQNEGNPPDCIHNKEEISDNIHNEEITGDCIQSEENNVQKSEVQVSSLTNKPVSKRGRKKAVPVKEIHLEKREDLLKMLKRDKQEPRPWDDSIDLKNPTYLFCNTCDKYMDSRELFESHVCKYGVGSGVLATICHNCSQVVILPSVQKPGRGRKKLMTDAPVHQCAARIFKCPFCTAAFVTKHQYRLHKLFHFAPEWMEYVVRPQDRKDEYELEHIKQSEDLEIMNVAELTAPRDLTAPIEE